LLALALVLATAVPSAAEPVAPGVTGKRERINLTHRRERDGFGVGVWGNALLDSDLPSIFINLFRGNFAGGNSVVLVVSKPFATFDLPLGRYALAGFWLEGEAQLLKHFGVEDHLEATLSLTLRSGEIRLGRHASVNLAIANGLSYAFSDPKWELGWTFQRGIDTPRLLYHIGLEAEFSTPAAPGWSAFARIHHRSDAYATFGPDWSTTNRIGAGIRYRFN
jgi:hypothetical protein